MTRAYIKLTRAALIVPGDGVFMLDDVPAGRYSKPGDPKKRWRCYNVAAVDTFGGNRIILLLTLRTVEKKELHYSRIVDKTEYLPRLVAWIREDEND